MTPIEELFQESLVTGDFSKFNEYYKKNPPQTVFDEDGVKHIQEVDLPAEYSNDPCACNRIHLVDDDTWYHKPMVLTTDDEIAVYRACKECRNILTKSLKGKE